MITRLQQIALVALLACLLLPASAQADFGFAPGSVSVTAQNKDGTIATQAASHPYSYTVRFALNTGPGGNTEGGEVRHARVDLPPGFFGNPTAIPACPQQDFEGGTPRCSPSTQVGVLRGILPTIGQFQGPVYNLVPPHGLATRFGFSGGNDSLISIQYASVKDEDGYRLTVVAPNLPVGPSQVTETIWGTPADPSHDSERGGSLEGATSDAPLIPYLTLPAACGTAPDATVAIASNLSPDSFIEALAPAIDAGGNPVPMSGCEVVPFSPQIVSQPTTTLASNPSGLDFDLKLPNQGLLDPKGITETVPKKVVVTLPEGVTINPSLAEGIGVCSQAGYAAERIDSAPGAGCPQDSRIGSVVAQTPLLEEPLEGSVYLATPYENPFGTFSALYIVLRAPAAGVIIKQAGKVEFDEATGQITTTFEDLPPLPFSSFRFAFREGARAPLATPAACGTYTTTALLTPFSAKDDSEAVLRHSSFQIEHGADGGACPAGGLPPFRPGLIAGTLNNSAGRFSPFNVRLFRTDTEQEITRFSIKLPPGLVGKLAGIPFCPDAAIEAARARAGIHAGQEEIEHPSCPAASEVGHSLAGGGVGQVLAYAPGKIYLAGPYNGSAVSLAAITAVKVGPFDLGTVVIRQALRVNPETGEVFIDATGSDPIPHIFKGVPGHLRDIRAYVDRPEFVLNPSSCAPTSTSSTLLGSGLDFASQADDNPVVVSTRFQAADCAALPFKPKLTLKLKGSTRRAGNPALKAHLAMNGIGEAGLAYAQVALPKSLFLDNAHIGTVCTRVQFRQGQVEGEKCPAGSIIGSAQALTPILDQPLAGPIYLRSNPERDLPDIAASLHGQQISVIAVGHTDSAPGGGLRNTFEVIPDAPVSSVDIDLFGGKRGLIESSRNLCSYKPKAAVNFKGHNGKQANYPKLKMKATGCKKKGTGKKGKRR